MKVRKTVKLTRELLNDQLEESVNLNETFSPSMPDWLKSALLTSDLDRYPNYPKQGTSQISRKERRDHLRNKGEFSTANTGNDFLQKLLTQAHIDVSKAKFFTGEIPQNARDPRLKEPYLDFFLVEDPYHGQYVVAKDINDDLKFPGGNDSFKYTSIKKLLEKTKAFCFVDVSDPNNITLDKRKSRSQMQGELMNVPNYYRNTEQAGKKDRWTEKSYDKSGYLINPDKYTTKLKELKRNDINGLLDKYHDRLEALKQRGIKLISDSDVKQLARDSSTKRSSQGGRLLSSEYFTRLSKACEYYNEACEAIEEILRSEDPQDVKDRELDDLIFGKYSKIHDVEEAIQEMNNVFKSTERAKINWR